MNGSGKDRAYRIAGMAGLAVLLGLIFRAGQPRPPEAPAHDHSDPAQHGHAVEGRALDEHEAVHLQPGGRMEEGIRVIDYDAFQYQFEPDPLVVRANEKVRLMIKSRDVTHGVTIPEVNFSTEIRPGDRRATEFTAPKQPGEYPVFCNVFCGSGHGEMKGRLIVLPAAQEHGHE